MRDALESVLSGVGETSEVGEILRVQRTPELRAEGVTMVDSDKMFLDLKKEVIEARNLVIKNDNLLKSLHGDVKKVIDKQEAFEKRAWGTSVTAYIIIAALSAVGAYKFASVEVRATTEELVGARAARKNAEDTAGQIRAQQEATERASKKALEVFDRLAGDDDVQRAEALNELAKMDMKKLSPMEQRALEDKSRALRAEAARQALEAGRTALNRRDWKSANDALTRYMTMTTKIDDQANLMLGEARHALRQYKDAVEPLQKFLKDSPNSKQADYATSLLGDALAESGNLKEAVEVNRNGGMRFYASQYGALMRARARRLEKLQKDADKLSPTPATAPVAQDGAIH
jgi:tetratricopeptide (TPR) repeat protein